MRISCSRSLIFASVFVHLFSFGCINQKYDNQIDRLQQLHEFSLNQKIDLSDYEYILVEGRIKCDACSKIWKTEIEVGPLSMSSTLIISGDNSSKANYPLPEAKYFITDFDSIERAFPYIANYFLYFRVGGEFIGFEELGSKIFPIPESN